MVDYSYYNLVDNLKLYLFLQLQRTYFNSPENLKQFQNPLYEPNENVIWPSLYSQSISVWTSLFLRHQRNDKPQKEVSAELEKMVEANKQAREKVDRLRK